MQKLNDDLVEQVVGGTVRFNGTMMKVQFTVLGETLDVKNCSDTDAMMEIIRLYSQYKTQGNRAFETATKESFAQKGWI